MSTDLDIGLPARRFGKPSWPSRVGSSSAFTITLSVALHAAVFLGFYPVVFREARESRRTIIPEARLAPIGGSGANQAGQMPRLSPPRIPPRDRADRPVQAAPARPAPTLADMPVLAVDLMSAPEPLSAQDSSRLSPRLAAGAPLISTGGTAAHGGMGTAGPATSFFGVAGNAYKVVYVVDVSNSLMMTLDQQIAAEMKRAIRGLAASQQFHLILATPLRVIEFGPRRLVYATAANKQAAIQFIEANVRPTQDRGIHAPVEGLRRAFDIRPELVYFLSDGDFLLEDERAALKNLVSEKSPNGEIKLTTLGFGSGDRGLLEQLARQTGGNFRYTDYK